MTARSVSQAEVQITELRSKDPGRRIRARKTLVSMGKLAVPLLVELLHDRAEHVRWEACKTLGQIKDPAAAPALVEALRDENMEIQWLAAVALIALRRKAIVPLLESLERDFESAYLRQGAHHVLHALEREKLLNKDTIAVVDSLRSMEPVGEIAVAARKVLSSLRQAAGEDRK